MTILDHLTKTLKHASGLGLNILKTTSWPVPIDEKQVNEAVSRALPAGVVEHVSLSIHDDYISVVTMVNLKSGMYCATTSFSITKASLTDTEQRIVLRRKGPLLIMGTSGLSRVMAFAYRMLRKVFPGYDLLKVLMQSASGVYVNGDTWTVDLKELGFRDALENLLAERIHAALPSARVLAPTATTLLMQHVRVEKIHIQNGKLHVYVRFMS